MSNVRSSGWRTKQGHAAYLAAYDAAMELWPVPFESRQVPTRYGSNHVIVSGPPAGDPIVLLHAATGFGATQWYPNVAKLIERHRVYAVDFIGSAGKGTQTKPIMTHGDSANWVSDVLDGLEIGRANLAGSSQGGWLAINFALLQPERLQPVNLTTPPGDTIPANR